MDEAEILPGVLLIKGPQMTSFKKFWKRACDTLFRLETFLGAFTRKNPDGNKSVMRDLFGRGPPRLIRLFQTSNKNESFEGLGRRDVQLATGDFPFTSQLLFLMGNQSPHD